MSLSFETLKSDWIFIILTSIIFAVGTVVAIWDFVQLQKTIWILGPINRIGLIMFIGGTILRQTGKHTLGKNYSYGLRTFKNQELVKHGVYKYVRHPITLAAIIYTPALPLVFSSLYGFLIMLLIVPLFLHRIEIEEKMMIEKFGSEYLEYMKRTKKLIPFIY